MSKSEDSDFPFARQIQSVGWAERCLLLTSSTLQANHQEERLHPLQAVGHFLCSQSLSINTMDYGKNDSLIKLLYAIAQGNLDQIMGEETEKLEAVKNICDISEIQLQKVKKCLEQGDKVSSKKALSYVDDTLSFLQRQRRKYCDAIETTPVEETPPSVYLNRKRPASALEPDNKELDTELYEFVQRFKSGKSDRTNWKKCFEQGHIEKISSIKQFNSSESLRCHYNRKFK